jgi:hypothetical protein
LTSIQSYRNCWVRFVVQRAAFSGRRALFLLSVYVSSLPVVSTVRNIKILRHLLQCFIEEHREPDDLTSIQSYRNCWVRFVFGA